jgi:hypothetical protein
LEPARHAIVSDGVFSAEGEFLPFSALDTAAVMEVFRRLLLERLHPTLKSASVSHLRCPMIGHRKPRPYEGVQRSAKSHKTNA